ncbi:MAG: hypothetical protein L3K05_04015, partial [Thermoplasmata archaeon]|nr:hypothetical protein [Thermoplasmata archaeon]
RRTPRLTEEPRIHWRLGEPWPRGWHRPRFVKEDGHQVVFIEIYNDTALTTDLGYPVDSMIGLPDKLGRTDEDAWVLWEEKGRDNVKKALRQLEDGLGNLLKLGKRVDRLGISLDRFDGVEPWKRHPLGYLMPKAQVHATPFEVSGRKVWVEQRGN